jgi:hypothetical protein
LTHHSFTFLLSFFLRCSCFLQLNMSVRIAAKRGAAAMKAGNLSALSNCPPKRNAAQAQARLASTSTNLPDDVKKEIYVRPISSICAYGVQ